MENLLSSPSLPEAWGVWARTTFPLQEQNSPGWLPCLLNRMDTHLVPPFTLSTCTHLGWLECINEELESQSITLTVTHILQKRQTHLGDGLHLSLSSWTFACHTERGLWDLQSSNWCCCCYAQCSGEWQGSWVAGREPSWESLGLFCLPIQAVIRHQPPPPNKASWPHADVKPQSQGKH